MYRRAYRKRMIQEESFSFHLALSIIVLFEFSLHHRQFDADVLTFTSLSLMMITLHKL